MTAADLARDAQQAGAAHELHAPSAFIADDVFLTKAGHVGMVWRFDGVDSEGLDHAQRAAVALRFRAALGLLDERFRIYSYLVKSPIAPLVAPTAAHPRVAAALAARTVDLAARGDDRFEIALYLVVLFEEMAAPSAAVLVRRRLQAVLAATAAVDAMDQDLTRAVDALRHAATGLEAHLRDIAPLARLEKAAIFAFFRRLVNYDGPHVALKYDTDVDFYMGDAGITWHRSGAFWDAHRVHLDVGGHRVAVLTMKEAPTHTLAALLDDLAAVPVAAIACLEWRRIPHDVMRREITMRIKHFTGIRGKVSNPTIEAKLAAHHEALLEIDVRGRTYGSCYLTLVLHDADVARVARAAEDARKLFASREGVLMLESYKQLPAWAGMVPGNRAGATLPSGAHQLQRLAMLDTNAADLAFLFAPDHGVRDRACAVLEAKHGALYHYALHVGDVGHTLIAGQTGSGKSYFVNFLILQLQALAAQTVVFDVGHSYRSLVGTLGGSYLAMGLQAGVAINPFALEPSPETWHFQHAFCRVLIDGDDFQITTEEDRELYEAITHLYRLPPRLRRLQTLLLSRRLDARLAPWVGDGRFASVFDHEGDELEIANLQAFDFEAMHAYPQIAEAVVFYLIHRLKVRMQARRGLMVVVMDEAWLLIKHPKIRAYVEELLKTARKHGGALVLVTQSVDDLLASGLQQTVIESCPTKFLLANPDLTRARYAAAFGLNETELDLVTALLPKRQVLLKRQGITKVLDVHVDPVSAALFTGAV